MKEGWEYKKLGEVCRKSNNIKWDDVSNDASFRYIDLTSVDRNDLCIHNPQIITKENAPSRAKQIIKAGDVIFATTRPTLRRVSLIDEIYDGDICSTGFCVLRPNIEINSKFIFYALLNEGFYKYIEPLQTGANYPAVTDSVVKNYIIPVPPLSEQQSIVDYLGSAFAKIDAMKANAEKALNEAKALFQASLKEMLEPKEGWEEKKLKELCETITDFVAAGSFASLRENVVYNNEKDYAQLVRTTDLKSGFSKGGYVYVNEHAFKYLYRVNLDKECIILPNVGVNCGEVYFVTPSILPYNNNVLGPNAVLVRSNNYSNHFLSYLFLGKDFQNKLSDITSHMAQPKFNKTGLKEIVISVPPQSEQQSIVATLDSLKSKVDSLQENFDKISQECDALKQAILRQVFE